MADPAPKGRPRTRQRAAAKSRPEKKRITEPLTPECIRELGTGGPWESDEEFKEFLDDLSESRSRD
jgi:hypothetical protein